MTRFITAALFAGAISMLPNPQPADAKSKVTSCLNEAIGSCDEDFQGSSFYIVSIRGYCYAIRAGMCYALDRKYR